MNINTIYLEILQQVINSGQTSSKAPNKSFVIDNLSSKSDLYCRLSVVSEESATHGNLSLDVTLALTSSNSLYSVD